MNIQYLTQLRDNPVKYPNDTTHRFPIIGIPETEIAQLEQLYNNGNPFPKILKELLFLAGNRCYVFDYGISETQQEMQEWAREQMQDNNIVENRPFYVFDYYGGYSFRFIYLDEGDNPQVYEGTPYHDESLSWKRPLGNTIQIIVNIRVQDVKDGLNPF